jgi:hypothetical protein
MCAGRNDLPANRCFFCLLLEKAASKAVFLYAPKSAQRLMTLAHTSFILAPVAATTPG